MCTFPGPLIPLTPGLEDILAEKVNIIFIEEEINYVGGIPNNKVFNEFGNIYSEKFSFKNDTWRFKIEILLCLKCLFVISDY